MKCMKKWFALLTACLVLALTLTACTAAPATSDKTAAPANDQTAVPANEGTEQTDWDYISGKGTLVIGYTVYEPMNYPDETGKLVGFDTEFAEAVGPFTSLPADGETPSATGVYANLPSGVAPVLAPRGTFADTG